MMIKFSVILFFLWTVYDRVKSTFKDKSFTTKSVDRLEKLHSLLVVVVYSAIALDGLIIFLRSKGGISVFLVGTGVFLYFVARLLRNSAIKTLGSQWNNHTSAVPISRIMEIGPFFYTRHPYYTGTFLDLLAYALLFGAPRTVVLTVVFYLPLLLYRVFVEERKLVEKFPKVYPRYKADVGVLFSFRRYLQDLAFVKDISQLLEIIKRFGLRQLARIRNMSQSVARYSRGYAVSRIAGAMIEIGMIERLLRDGSIDLINFSKEQNFDLETLKTISDYFSVLGIFEKHHFVYRLTPYGEKLFHDSKGALTLLYAYMPVFESLPEIIRKEKEYGVDIFRKSEFVGRGSNELATLLPFPYARDILKRNHLRSILDIGCGAGEFLISFCRGNGFRGYGIDLSPEVIAVAKRTAEVRGASGSVKFGVGDVHALRNLKEDFKKVDVITFMFVLHEFLAHGREGVVGILKAVKENFPDKFVLVSEVCRWSVPQLTKNPVPIAEHHLFHKLSQQGLATVKEWKSMFDDAGFDLVEERRFDRAAQAYFLLKARSN